MAHIATYDCTLRDGEQAEGISFSLDDKLEVAKRLDAFGIDYIEGGYPYSNPKDAAFFAQVGKLGLTHAKIAAFGPVCKKDTAPDADEGLAALLSCGAPVLCVFGKTSLAHVEKVLQTTPEENLRMISDTVAFLKAAGREVVFDAEHFFDGYKANAEYAMQCLEAASSAGADTLCLCETNGGALPFEVEEITAVVCAAFPDVQVGIHCHDDAGCAVANTLASVRAGARMVQGCVNGIGERVGNTDLLTVIADLELKMGHDCVGPEHLRELTSVSLFVAECASVSLPRRHPYTGAAAFTHKAGLHASATVRYPEAYLHIDPSAVGNGSSTVVSELASRASLIERAKTFGIDLSPMASSDVVRGILDDIKAREAQGYSYEVADGSLAMLITRHLGTYRSYFSLESFRVIVDDYEDQGALAKGAMSEATVKVHVGAERFVATGEGVGPVDALDNALRMTITKFYPEVANFELVDFKVRILDENVGTDAITRVLIVTRDATGTWGSVGLSDNVLEASWNALVDSIEYGLTRAGVVPVSE